MKVVVSPRAYRQRKKLSPQLKKLTLHLIQKLANNPFPPKSKKLSGREGYRLRYGDYRIIYTVDKNSKIITVTAIAHRRMIYKLF